MENLSLTVHETGAGALVNAGFQNPRRPAWYLATQDVIVPKQLLFAHVCEQLRALGGASGGSLKLFEPGVGVGDFFQYVLTATDLARCFKLHLIGADVSREMIDVCQAQLRALAPDARWQRVVIELHSGVNLLDEAALNRLLHRHGQVDAIFASQFEHYYPNCDHSPLAEKLRAANLPFLTKRRFRSTLAAALRQGGQYFTLDDYSADQPHEDALHVEAWDRYVVEQFSHPPFVQALARRFPAVAESLRKAYDPRLGVERLRRKAALARQRRRSVCLEERQTLSSALAELRGSFNTPHVSVTKHPLGATHALFYLLGVKK